MLCSADGLVQLQLHRASITPLLPFVERLVMKSRNQFMCAICMAVMALSLATSAQEPPAQQPQFQPQQQSDDNQPSSQAGDSQQDADSSSPDTQDLSDCDCAAIGVLLGPCPGQGVCVLDTMPGSPSEIVGIEPGDYILAVNDQAVSSPEEFMQEIEKLDSVDAIKVSVWRMGETSTKEVRLAAEAKELPASRRSWLGVMLSGGSEPHTGVTIQRVHSGGPAEQAGLLPGDRVMAINGDRVEAVDKFVELVQDYEPGDKLELLVQRGSQELELSAELGDVRDAPLQWFRQSFRMPMDEDDSRAESFSGTEFDSPAAPEMAVIEEVIEDMRQQIRALQQQVDELKNAATPGVENAVEGAEQAPDAQSDQPDVSHFEASPSKTIKLVQYDGRRRYPSSSRNDWRGSRYDRDYNRGYYRNYDRSYDRYRSSYRPNYGTRVYRSYPYSYYNYGGRPYYYGGSYPYGYRGGLQIGPNLSIRW